jgi:hypothetical protein
MTVTDQLPRVPTLQALLQLRQALQSLITALVGHLNLHTPQDPPGTYLQYLTDPNQRSLMRPLIRKDVFGTVNIEDEFLSAILIGAPGTTVELFMQRDFHTEHGSATVSTDRGFAALVPHMEQISEDGVVTSAPAVDAGSVTVHGPLVQDNSTARLDNLPNNTLGRSISSWQIHMPA